MSDSSQHSSTAARKVTAAATAAGPSPLRRFLEVLFMLFSAILVMFSWDTANKANEENAVLRAELRRTKKYGNNADASGTRCTVCLDNPREILLQDCGHVCLCRDCASRIRYEGNKCPVCRQEIHATQSVYIS